MNKVNILVKKRKSLDLTQQEMADKIGITRQYYNELENGRLPSIKMAKKLGKLLKVDWKLFFGD